MQPQPILEPGLHDFELNDISNHFLKNFPNSKTRRLLINGLNEFVAHLSSLGIPIELWIDGSFTTNKENPNDIDLVIFLLKTYSMNYLLKTRNVFCTYR